MTRDHRDAVISMLADSEAVLIERVASLEADVETYRELTVAAFDALRAVTVARHRDRCQHQQVREEYAALRERLLLQAGIDDERGRVISNTKQVSLLPPSQDFVQ